MKNNNQSNKMGQKIDSMNAMDQGTNLFSQLFNNITGVDKGNDGKKGDQK